MSQIRRLDLDKGRYDMSTFWGRAKYYFATTNPLNTFARWVGIWFQILMNRMMQRWRACACEEDRARLQSRKRCESIRQWNLGLYDALHLCVHFSASSLWQRAKELYDSAFHSQTGEKLILPGELTTAGKPFVRRLDSIENDIIQDACHSKFLEIWSLQGAWWHSIRQLLPSFSGKLWIRCGAMGCMLGDYEITYCFGFQSFNALVNYTNRNASAGVTSTQLGQLFCFVEAAH